MLWNSYLAETRNNTLPNASNEQEWKKWGLKNVYGINNIKIHEKYQPNSKEYDIAILTIQGKMDLNGNVKSGKLMKKKFISKPRSKSIFICCIFEVTFTNHDIFLGGRKCYVAGWGSTANSSEYAM